MEPMHRGRPPQRRKKKKPFILRLLKALAMVPVMGVHAAGRWFRRAKPAVRIIAACSAAGVVAGLVLLLSLSGKTQKLSPAMEYDGLPEETGRQTAETTLGTVPAVQTTPVVRDGKHPLGDRVLRKGTEDELVSEIQARLMALAYLDSDQPTNFFGPHTHDSIRTFQTHNGLPESGEVDAAMYDLLMGPGAIAFVMQNGDEGDDVRAIQQRLFQLGYLQTEHVTGHFGDVTETALKEFQGKNRLGADGKVGRQTEDMLYDESVVATAYQKGDSDPVIGEYQLMLVKLGYLEDKYEAKGKMDAETVNAIKIFQDANSLVRDGCLGPETMEQLHDAKAVKYALRLGMSGSEVKRVQKKLQDLKYLTSAQVTGYFGEQTELAVKDFQKRNKLSEDGAVGGKTQDKMFSIDAKKAATPTKESSAKSSGSSGSKSSSSSSKPTAAPKKTGVEKMIAAAESKKGSNYVRGGKGPNTFDCSGFVHWCLRQAGVSHSYMTSTQWRKSSKYKKISSMSSLKRGDILVFSGETEGEGHVGIYMGSNKMIDASASYGEVRTTSIGSPYWEKHFLMGFRIWD